MSNIAGDGTAAAPVAEPAAAPPVVEPVVAPEPTPVDKGGEPPATVDTGRFNDWRDQIHESIRGNDVFKDMKGPDDLAHAYLDRLDGFYRLPSKDATEEEVTNYYKSIGIPEGIETYTEAVKDVKMPEGIEADADFIAEATQQAYELRMYPYQLKEIVTWYYDRLGKVAEGMHTQALKDKDEGLQQMKRDWGADYQTNTAIVDRALKALGGDDLIGWAEEVGIANDPTFLRLVFNIGKNLTEDMVLAGVPVTGGGTPEKQQHLTYKSTGTKGKT